MLEFDNDYEGAILANQESEEEYCDTCEYRKNCKSQCDEVEVVYNPNLLRMIR